MSHGARCAFHHRGDTGYGARGSARMSEMQGASNAISRRQLLTARWR
jgi:hypothetical protein